MKALKTRRTNEQVLRSGDKRITVCTKVIPETWIKLNNARQTYGIRSLYVLVSGVLDMFVKHLDLMNGTDDSPQTFTEDCQELFSQIEKRIKGDEPETIEEEVEDMFRQYSDFQLPKYGCRTKRSHDPWDRFGESQTVSLEDLVSEPSTEDEE